MLSTLATCCGVTQQAVQHHTAHRPFSEGWGRELDEKTNKIELVGWDKNHLLRQKRKREIIVMTVSFFVSLCLSLLTKRVMHTPASWWPSSPWAVAATRPIPLGFVVLWYGISLWPDWVSCPGSVLSGDPCWQDSPGRWGAEISLGSSAQ